MNEYEAKKAIANLSKKIDDLRGKAYREHRSLTAAELGLVCEIEVEIEELRKHLPAKALTLQNFGGGHRTDAAGPFRSMGEQLTALARSSAPGAQVDPRLYQITAAAGLSESVPSDGAFLVQSDFSNEILASVFASGTVSSLCRRIQISSNANSIKIPGLDETSRANGSRWGGVQSYWSAEASELHVTKPKFRQIELVLKKQAVLVFVTDELLQDSTVLEAVVKRMASDELTFTLEDAIINGTGAGQPLGILNSGGLVTVAKEPGQAAGTILYENLRLMWSRLIGNSRANAVWLINQSVEPQLYSMSLSVGTGGAPVFMPAGGASAQPYMTLFGRPIIVSEHCQTLGTVGDIILADLTNGYILAEKGGVQSAMSIHVRFVYDESLFRFTMRVDGQPVLSQPITPYKGGAANSQGHFVALATRS